MANNAHAQDVQNGSIKHVVDSMRGDLCHRSRMEVFHAHFLALNSTRSAVVVLGKSEVPLKEKIFYGFTPSFFAIYNDLARTPALTPSISKSVFDNVSPLGLLQAQWQQLVH